MGVKGLCKRSRELFPIQKCFLVVSESWHVTSSFNNVFQKVMQWTEGPKSKRPQFITKGKVTFILGKK